MLVVLRTDFGVLHCHVWETIYESVSLSRYIPYDKRTKKVMMLRQMPGFQLASCGECSALVIQLDLQQSMLVITHGMYPRKQHTRNIDQKVA